MVVPVLSSILRVALKLALALIFMCATRQAVFPNPGIGRSIGMGTVSRPQAGASLVLSTETNKDLDYTNALIFKQKMLFRIYL